MNKGHVAILAPFHQYWSRPKVNTIFQYVGQY